MDEPRSTAPTVTVITVVRNGEKTVERAIRSVLAQTHRPLEHVVVDGISTDRTLEIVRRYGSHLSWTSEPDRGIYDAMNKGLALVSDPESYVLFLNADDRFASDDAVADMMARSAGDDFLYGKLERRDDPLGHTDVIGKPVHLRDLLFGMKCHHQAIFCRRRVFDRLGGFDPAYRLAADYDWVVRVFRDTRVTRRFVPVVVASVDRGGASDARYPESLQERWRIVRDHYPPADLALFTLYTPFGDYLRYYLQRALRPLGLLNVARALKGILSSAP